MPACLTLDGPVWLASDMHLGDDVPATVEAFVAFLGMAADDAAHLLLVGDLFDAWVGDDVLDAPPDWLARVVAALRETSRRIGVHIGPGNRDFLMGDRLAADTGTRRLAEPVVVQGHGGGFLLCHGDALCTDDVQYQQFRAMVRNPAWQAQFLAQPLAQRQAIARELRSRSQMEKSRKAADIMDVNPQAVRDALAASGQALLIHGHTHRPGRHVFEHEGRRMERLVLPDWDLDDAAQPRGGWLLVDQDGPVFHDIALES